MLKYYKGDGKAKWILSDEHHPISDATFETVLAFDRNPDDLESMLDQAYWGPFYIDIDDEDFPEAHRTAKAIARYLVQAYQLNADEDLQIFASGKKGFHILLNPYTFMDGKPKKLLPYRYKLMAAIIQKNISVKLDMVVYSGKKGRMWRRPNMKRSDNGKYKVPLTFMELISEDPEYIINNLCSAPRDNFNIGWKKKQRNPLVVSWFKSCEIPDVPDKVVLSSKDLKAMDIPEGIVKLSKLEDIKPDARFNILVLNAAVYAARVGWDVNKALDYFKKILEWHSSIYKSQTDKIEHFKNIFDFVKENEDYGFDCHFLASIVANIDCKKNEALKEGAEDYDDDFGIYVKDNSYYMASTNGPRRLTGFIMKITHDVETQEEVLYEIELKNARNRRKTILVPENSFATKSSFAKYLSPDYPLFCSDKEFAMISWSIRKEEPNLQIGRDYIGLHYVDNKWHYANSSGSISLDNDIDRIKVNAKSLGIVNTKLDYNWPDVTKEQLLTSMDSLMNFNRPQVTVPMVSWFFSAFFKPHYDKAFSQFPLLFIFGEAGAGKTATGLKLRRLFAMEDTALKSIADVTQFSLMAACNSSNLVPLILDEYKPMMMKETQTHLVSRLIRGAYNASRGERGTATQAIVTYYYRAPIVLLGEQSIIETAVQHRVVEVQLSRIYLKDSSYTEYFNKLDDLPLESIGKTFLTFAMGVSPDEIKKRLTRNLDSMGLKMPERPKFNLAVLKTTMDLLIEFYALYKIDIKDLIVDKFEAYIDFLKKGNGLIDEIAGKNDIIKILETINSMADFNASPVTISNNTHYVYSKESNTVYLNLQAIYPLFAKYNLDYKLGLFDPGYVSFLKMLQKESFCKSIRADDIIGGKKKIIVALDTEELKKAGVDFSTLKGE